MSLSDIGHAIGVDIELDRGLQKFDAFCCIDLFLDVGSLLVEIGSLSTLAEFVALDALDVGLGGIIPSLGEFVVGCGLFEKLDGFLSAFAFIGHDVAEEGAYVREELPLSAFWPCLKNYSAFLEYASPPSIQCIRLYLTNHPPQQITSYQTTSFNARNG